MRRLVVLSSVLLLAACSGPYDDLAKDFAVKDEPSGRDAEVHDVVLVSTKYSGAFSYRSIMRVSLTDDAIAIVPRFPLSLTTKKVKLTAQDVAACAMTCFGVNDQHVDVLLEAQGVDISFDAAPAFIDWCRRNDLPMISGHDKRAWLYSGDRLPDKSAYVRVDRGEYERRSHRACLGY